MSTRIQTLAADAVSILRDAATRFQPMSLASSLAAEDMVLTDLIARNRLAIGIFTLETGRLHAETVGMIERIRTHYGVELTIMRPDAEAVIRWVGEHGENAFYDSVDLRKQCCGLRKVEPLNRALATQAGWVTGQRREQSATRGHLQIEERDAERGIAKFNPLADWTEVDVWDYIRAHQVPYNPLHDRGYPSIGCEPCTRAIRPGEDPRAGRWWWESADTKECGLHLTADGKLVSARTISVLPAAGSAQE